MKLITLSIAFITLMNFVSAQEGVNNSNYKTHQIGFFIGSSGARGDYGDDKANNAKAGYANGGLALGLNYHYQWDENFAATIEYAGVAHVYDEIVHSRNLTSQQVGTGFATTITGEPYGYGYASFGVKGIVGKTIKGYINPSIGFASFIPPVGQNLTSENKPL